MHYFSKLKKSPIKLFIGERISTSILTSATSVSHSIKDVLNKHPRDILAFTCNPCRKLSDICWLLSRWDIPNFVFDIPPNEEKIPLHLNNLNRKEQKTFINLAAKNTETEMHE